MVVTRGGSGPNRAVIIGGCGFLGRHMVEGLHERHPDCKIVVFDVVLPRDPETWPENVEFVKGDIRNLDDLLKTFKGAEVVFHCASPSPALSNKQIFVDVNVTGTEKVIEACRKANVPKLVLTSSGSVVFEGKDIEDGDETLPYATSSLDFYSMTKVQQEKLVLAADDGDKLCTVAIRPHGIFGERDPQLVPTLVRTAQQGKMKFMIGNGKNLVDFTYVKNVVYGHLLAADEIHPGSPACGQAFFITNDEPIYFWEFLGYILEHLGYDRPKHHLNFQLIYILSCILMFFVWILKPFVNLNPTFTPFKVAIAGTAHYYSCKKARELLGYKPQYTLKDALLRTLPTYEHLRKK